MPDFLRLMVVHASLLFSILFATLAHAGPSDATAKLRQADRTIKGSLTRLIKADYLTHEGVEQLEAQRDILELNLYDAAEWFEPAELPAIIEKHDFKSSAAGGLARTLRARWLMARADALERRLLLQRASPSPPPPNTPVEMAAREARVNAYWELRQAGGSDDPMAERLARELELRFVQQIAAKLEREKQASLAAFANYLTARSYDLKQPETWWAAAKEFFYVYFTSGPITMLGGIEGTPGAVADATITVQNESARDHISLLVIMRLLRSGMPLAAIREIKTEALASAYVLGTASGEPLDPHRAWPIAQDIHATFAGIAELRALVAGNVDEFKRLYAKDYYQALDTDQSWGEYLGDLLSPRHLITLFGPGAIVKVGGQWATVGRMSATQIASLERGGRVVRGRDALVAAMRLDRAAGALGATRAGAALQRAVQADHEFMAGLEGWKQLTRVGSRVVAAVVLYAGAAHLAEESGIPGLRLLVDAIGEISGEEITYTLIRKAGAPTKRLLQHTDTYLRILQRERQGIEAVGKQLDELEEIASKAAAPAERGQVVLGKEDLERIKAMPEGGRPSPIVGDALPVTESASLPATLSPSEQARAQREAREKAGHALAVPQLSPGDSLDEAVAAAMRALREGDVAEARRALRTAKELREKLARELTEAERNALKAKKFLEGPERIGPAAAEPGLPITFEAIRMNKTPGPFTEGAEHNIVPTGAMVRTGDNALRRGEYDEALRQYRRAHREAENRAAAGQRVEGWKDTAEYIEQRIVLVETVERISRSVQRTRAAVPPLDVGRAIADTEIDDIARRLGSGDPAGGLAIVKRDKASKNPVFNVVDKDGNIAYVFKQLDDQEELMAESASAALINAAGGRAAATRRARFPGVELTWVDAAGVSHTEEAYGLLVRFVPGRQLWSLTEPGAIAVKFDALLHPDDMRQAIDGIRRLCADEERLREVLRAHVPAQDLENAVRVLRIRAEAIEGVIERNFPQYLRSRILDGGGVGPAIGRLALLPRAA